jgi:uncharacterized protein (DUF488 family)
VAEQARLTETDAAPLYTIGHSTRTLDELVDLLTANDIARLFDVRRYPNSRRHPQFNEGNLETELPRVGIAYTHREVLGGRRGPPDEDGPNDAWEAEGFQAYADHALGEAFQAALDDVLARADELQASGEGHTCVMCAEIVYFRCHRRIIADHAVARGREVHHIHGPDNVQRHEPPDFARMRDDAVVYPA